MRRPFPRPTDPAPAAARCARRRSRQHRRAVSHNPAYRAAFHALLDEVAQRLVAEFDRQVFGDWATPPPLVGLERFLTTPISREGIEP